MKYSKKLMIEKQCCFEGCQELATAIYRNKYLCSIHYFLTKKLSQLKKKEKLKRMEMNQ